MKEYIAKVAEGENLTEEEAKGAMDIMLSGDATQAQIAAFLALERVKGYVDIGVKEGVQQRAAV